VLKLALFKQSRISKFSHEGPLDPLFPRRKDAEEEGRNGLAERALAYLAYNWAI